MIGAVPRVVDRHSSFHKVFSRVLRECQSSARQKFIQCIRMKYFECLFMNGSVFREVWQLECPVRIMHASYEMVYLAPIVLYLVV